MPYVLTLFILAPHGDVQISEKFYNEIKEANEGLPKIVAAAEKFDAFMENFVELESTVLMLGARHLAFEQADITNLIEPRNLISRRIANFLSSGRLYRDSLPQHAWHILGRTDAKAKAFIASIAADAQPMGYRMVDALRNYVQHRELPLSEITFHHSRDVSQGETVAFPSWLEPAIDAVAVSKGRDVPKDVAAQLAKLGGKVNPMPLLREYVEHVGNMHQGFRKLIESKEGAWESSLARARERYKKRYPKESIVALGAGFRDASGRVSRRQYAPEDRAKYRQDLRIKHRTAVNFPIRYVKWSA